MERRVNVRAVIVDKDGKLFAVKHRDDNGQEMEYWATPGGGLDPAESLVDGLVRELVEETGIKPVVGKLLFIQQYVGIRRDGEKREGIELFFHVTNTEDYQIDIDLARASHGHEISRVAFIDPKTNDVLPMFMQSIDILDYVNNDKPVYFIDNLNEIVR